MEQNEETWWPSKQEYDPEITKENWIELLHDENIFDFNSMCMMHQMLDIGGNATNSELSKKYGIFDGYNGIVSHLAKRIIEKTNCKLPPQEENAKRFPVLFVVKKVQKDDEHDGTYIWKLRPELEEALMQMKENGELEKYPLYKKDRVYISRYFDETTSIQTGDHNMISNENSLVQTLSNLLKHTHNLILHGAPGTGKTHLAKEIAKELGYSKADVGFVQFHPSYDYTDFVEGLRPIKSSDGTSSIGFERKDGVFKEFCRQALKNLTDSKKSVEDLQKEISTDEQIENFLEKAIDDKTEFEIAHGNKFKIEDSSDKNILISIPANKITNELSLPKNDLVQLLNSDTKIESGADIKSFFNRKWRTQQDSYILTLYNEIKSQKQIKTVQNVQKIEKKNFIFIIDEINRGELSKIFGELFFCIDPGYRGEESRIQTQYQNLVEESDVFKDGFFVPENVYIIGTMNDIDRSVDTMDFAFRRRFTFYEIKAEENLSMLDEKTDKNGNKTGLPPKIANAAKIRITNLNNAISAIEGLNSSYHIGGAYFLKLNELDGDFEQLWNYHLEGLLREYLRGHDDAETELSELKKAYNNTVVEPVETTSQSDEENHSEQSE